MTLWTKGNITNRGQHHASLTKDDINNNKKHSNRRWLHNNSHFAAMKRCCSCFENTYVLPLMLDRLAHNARTV